MIDTHCHLNREDYSDLDEVIEKVNDIIIVSGADLKSNIETIELCKKYKNIYGTLGYHPSEVDNEIDFRLIEENMNNQKIVGIGEIGLDYHESKENKEKQKELFIKQIELAHKYNKCIVVHSREADMDTYEILKKYAKGLKIDIHCFSSSLEMAKEYIKLGCVLGIGGVITFKNGVKLKEVVKNIDLKHIMLETDSPWLSPFRGSRNEPYNIYYVGEEIARLKEISKEQVFLETRKNAINQFDLNI